MKLRSGFYSVVTKEARLKLDVIKRFSVYLKDNSTFDPDKRLDEIGEVAKKFFTKGQIT
jgi:hypothetical protein